MKELINWGQVIRKICITILFLILVLTLVVWPFRNIAIYFTNWTLLATLSSAISSLLAVADLDIMKKPGHLAVHHLLYTSSLAFNLATMTLYWTFVHKRNK